MNDREKQLQERRAHNDAWRASLPPGSKFSGPSVDVFFEGWALVGWNLPRKGHYWRRRPGDRLLSMCGVWKVFEYTIKGQLMIFEVGNHEKCTKCLRMRRRARL